MDNGELECIVYEEKGTEVSVFPLDICYVQHEVIIEGEEISATSLDVDSVELAIKKEPLGTNEIPENNSDDRGDQIVGFFPLGVEYVLKEVIVKDEEIQASSLSPEKDNAQPGVIVEKVEDTELQTVFLNDFDLTPENIGREVGVTKVTNRPNAQLDTFIRELPDTGETVTLAVDVNGVEYEITVEIGNQSLGIADIFHCDYCSRRFNDKRKLKKHIRIHTKKVYRCSVCYLEFPYRESLLVHMRSHGIKLFTCSYAPCGKSFTMKGHLTRHELTHTDLKPYRCDICGKTFNITSNLKEHRWSHEIKKRFKCDTCKQEFALKMQLLRHQGTHVSFEPYACELCTCSFKTKKLLNYHAKVQHVNGRLDCVSCQPYLMFRCQICHKEFSKRSRLARHSKFHSGIREHKCPLCEKAFFIRENLRTHMFSHDKKHICELCGKCYGQNFQLKQHVMKIHCKT